MLAFFVALYDGFSVRAVLEPRDEVTSRSHCRGYEASFTSQPVLFECPMFKANLKKYGQVKFVSV
jgi:hypothetical protein